MMRSVLAAAVALVGVLCLPPLPLAYGQTPTRTATQTSTATATVTPTFLPFAPAPPPGVSVTLPLLAAVTTTGVSPVQDVSKYSRAQVQVIVGSPCTSYTLAIESTLQVASPTWGALTTITQTTVAAGSSAFIPIQLPTGWVRANLSAVSGCTGAITVNLVACAQCGMEPPSGMLPGITLDPRTYGARVDGVTDDTAAISAAISACPSAGCTITMPAPMKFGALTNTKPIFFDLQAGSYTVIDGATAPGISDVSHYGGIWKGKGPTATKFLWAGSTRNPMWYIADTQRTVYQDFSINPTSAAPLNVAFFLENDASQGVVNPRMRVFRNITIDGTTSGASSGLLTKVVDYANPSNAACTANLVPWYCCTGNATGNCVTGSDTNNDTDLWEQVAIQNGATASVGWTIEHSQSVAHNFLNCRMSTLGYGLQTTTGGFATWVGGNGGSNAGGDFYLGTPPNRGVTIMGWDSENSTGPLLLTAGPSSGEWPVNLIGNRFSANGFITNATCTGAGAPQPCCTGVGAGYCDTVVYVQNSGPVNIIGNYLGLSTAAITIVKTNTGSNADMTVNVQGNYLLSTSATPLVAGHNTHERFIVRGNRLNNNGTHATLADWDSYLGMAQASLASFAPINGTIMYCTDCTVANPCASGGTGALAKRLNGVWVCN